jgi:hypothetical protein
MLKDQVHGGYNYNSPPPPHFLGSVEIGYPL